MDDVILNDSNINPKKENSDTNIKNKKDEDICNFFIKNEKKKFDDKDSCFSDFSNKINAVKNDIQAKDLSYLCRSSSKFNSDRKLNGFGSENKRFYTEASNEVSSENRIKLKYEPFTIKAFNLNNYENVNLNSKEFELSENHKIFLQDDDQNTHAEPINPIYHHPLDSKRYLNI